MSQIMFSLPRILIPSVAGVLGLTGIAGGVYSFASPAQCIGGFGLRPPADAGSTQAEAFQIALIRAYGIRNIGSGLSTLALVIWFIGEGNEARKETIKRCLGLSMMMGTAVATGDAWLTHSYANSRHCSAHAQQTATDAAKGHVAAAVLICTIGASLFFTY